MYSVWVSHVPSLTEEAHSPSVNPSPSLLHYQWVMAMFARSHHPRSHCELPPRHPPPHQGRKCQDYKCTLSLPEKLGSLWLLRPMS